MNSFKKIFFDTVFTFEADVERFFSLENRERKYEREVFMARLLAEENNKQRNKELHDKIQKGKCKIVQHNGKTYACEEKSEGIYTIYPAIKVPKGPFKQKKDLFEADEYISLTTNCVAKGVQGGFSGYSNYDEQLGLSDTIEEPTKGKLRYLGQEHGRKNVWLLSEDVSISTRKHHKVPKEILESPYGFPKKALKSSLFVPYYFEPKKEVLYGQSEDSLKVAEIKDIRLPLDKKALPKEIADYYKTLKEPSQTPESLLTDRKTVLVSLYEKMHHNSTHELLDIISMTYPESVVGSAYAKYKEQMIAQERQSRIAESKQRLTDNKEKLPEKIVENTSEQTQAQVKESEHIKIKDDNQTETLMVNKVISNKSQHI